MKTLFSGLLRSNRAFSTSILLAVLLAFIPSGIAGAQEPGTGPLAGKIGHAAECDKVHLIVTGFVSGSAKDIGADCQNDLLAVQGLFATVFNQKGWRDRLVIYPLYSASWTATKILEFGRTMKVGQNDVVFFYQAGHGVIKDGAQPISSHLLQVGPGEYVRRSQVRDMLLQRGCRGVVILTDCCSNIGKQNVTNRSAGNEPTIARLNPTTVRNLFLKFRGLVDITAAEVGSSAQNGNHLGNFGEARGAFTTAFLRVASESQVHENWQGFFRILQQTTLTSSGGKHRACVLQIRENVAPQIQPIKFRPEGTVTAKRFAGPTD